MYRGATDQPASMDRTSIGIDDGSCHTFCYLGDMLSVDGDADAAVGLEYVSDGIN